MNRCLKLSWLIVLALSATDATAQAQEHTQEYVLEALAPPTDSNSFGTSPGGMGSTGWTGGNAAYIGTSNVHTTGQAPSPWTLSTVDQPLMATGEDLNGPPVRFPATDTPE